jgi:hypothetical protein
MQSLVRKRLRGRGGEAGEEEGPREDGGRRGVRGPRVAVPSTCKFCGEEFVSKRALFRHLRGDNDCARNPENEASVLLGKYSHIDIDKETCIDVKETYTLNKPKP